jgi:putative ABC transport system permease protein
VDAIPLGVAPGADVATVKRSIERSLGTKFGLQVDTRDQYFGRLNSLSSSLLDLVSSVQLVAVIVAALGLANTLLISTLERRRELGVLRAVGLLRKQVRRMVAMEALMVGALGVVLSWALGTVMGAFLFRIIEVQAGQRLHLVLPPSGYAGVAVLGFVGAVAAAAYPAHRASRVDIVEALRYE